MSGRGIGSGSGIAKRFKDQALYKKLIPSCHNNLDAFNLQHIYDLTKILNCKDNIYAL